MLPNSLMKFIVLYALLLTNTVLLAAPTKERITIKGSDTMVILVQRWTEVYRNKMKLEFQITGGGSGTGIAALINGTTDICASSRPIKKDEVQQLIDKSGYRGMEIRVARDGLSVYVNKSNPISRLTIDQIKQIFTGQITNWKSIGGPDKKIILYSRENNSGTYEFFKEHVLNKQDFSSATQHMAGTAALINAISKDPFSIGYGGAAYAKNVKAIAIAKTASETYVLPEEKSILNGEYPISRFLYFYTSKRPEGTVKKFIDWVISPQGQKVVREVGYYPIK